MFYLLVSSMKLITEDALKDVFYVLIQLETIMIPSCTFRDQNERSLTFRDQNECLLFNYIKKIHRWSKVGVGAQKLYKIKGVNNYNCLWTWGGVTIVLECLKITKSIFECIFWYFVWSSICLSLIVWSSNMLLGS